MLKNSHFCWILAVSLTDLDMLFAVSSVLFHSLFSVIPSSSMFTFSSLHFCLSSLGKKAVLLFRNVCLSKEVYCKLGLMAWSLSLQKLCSLSSSASL